MGVEIILPRWAEQPAFICNVPQADGSPCGAQFYADQRRQYRLHVERCARGHEEEISQQAVHRRIPELYASDKELEAWAREHATEIEEGRKRL